MYILIDLRLDLGLRQWEGKPVHPEGHRFETLAPGIFEAATYS